MALEVELVRLDSKEYPHQLSAESLAHKTAELVLALVPDLPRATCSPVKLEPPARAAEAVLENKLTLS